MYLTREEKQLIIAVYEVWKEYSSAHITCRKRKVRLFTREWRSKVNLTKPIMRHPSTRQKDYRCNRSALDILTDLILDVDQVRENNEEEYPIHNAEKELRNERRPTYAIVDESTDDEAPRKPLTIDMNDVPGINNVEAVLFAEPTASTVPELIALINEVKANEDYYVNLYGDEAQDWNERTSAKKRTFANVRKEIRSLDVSRVRECAECGGAYYAHDLRRNACDTQRYKDRKGRLSKYSLCEIKQKRKRKKNAEKAKKTA